MQVNYHGKRPEPLVLRITRWSSALAVGVVMASACRIYGDVDFGGTLAAVQQWQAAALWLLAQNILVYFVYFVFSGRWRGRITAFPLSPAKSRKGASPARAGLAHWPPQAAFRG